MAFELPGTTFKPVVRAACVGLGSAIAGPLGTATGAFVGGAFGDIFGASLVHLLETTSERFIERVNETFFDKSAESLYERLRGSRPTLEVIYRQAFRHSLEQIRPHCEKEHDDWFVNWDCALQSEVTVILEEIQPTQIDTNQFESLFRAAMERLDAQGSAIQCESRSLILKIRPAPELLLSELRKQLPEYFKGGFRSLIVQPENAAVWNEAELLFRDWFSTAITGIKETLESVDRKTDALPRIESLLHELLRFTAVPSAQIGWGFSHGGAENEKPPAKQKISTALESAIEAARIASRKHDYDSALKLWEEVRKQAISEGSNEEEFNARLEIILVQLRDEMNPTEALRMADECLRDSKDTNLGEERCRVLQIIGEIHRFQGNRDQARGYLTGALESARRIGSPRNEGYALLALSALEGSSTEDGVRSKAFGMIEQAFNSFSSLYASGDIEEQNMAKIGFAECHRWTATLLSCSRPDDALEAWTHSIEVFEALGESWKWDLAEALLCRAELRERLGDRHAAFAEIERSAKTFSQIGDTMGVARCYLKTGELLDSIGKRDIAVEPYKKAAKIAATWNNTPKASYFFFRHACKLMELKKYKDADRILSFLAEAEGLEKHIRLTVFSQLCLISCVFR
jgi:tetratricopeptide (TPR) repeat protein